MGQQHFRHAEASIFPRMDKNFIRMDTYKLKFG